MSFDKFKFEKTAVYSGKSRGTKYTHVLRLEELCLRVLMDHVDRLTCFGNAPYYLLSPVLAKATPEQLFTLEDHNDCLVDEDDDLWETHCRRDFKKKSPTEDETWRELYIRSKYERELKLKSITATIKTKTIAKAAPVRQTKMAFVDGVAKPPKGVKRKQEINGTATNSVHYPKPGATGRESRVVRPTATKATKKAPLMLKTLKIMKNRRAR